MISIRENVSMPVYIKNSDGVVEQQIRNCIVFDIDSSGFTKEDKKLISEYKILQGLFNGKE